MFFNMNDIDADAKGKHRIVYNIQPVYLLIRFTQKYIMLAAYYQEETELYYHRMCVVFI